MKHYFLFLYLTLSAHVSGQGRYFVSQNATGANTGLSWADAFSDLQSALQIAEDGDEVWVAAGTYLPTAGADRSISFEPANGVQLYGGFSGAEAFLSQRDWVQNITTLSGDIGITGDSADNSYNVLYWANPDSNSCLNGFVIRDGVADDPISNPFFRGKSGGGVYINGDNGSAYPEIRNCIFTHNTAMSYGGGLMVYGGSGSVAPKLIQCRFEQNHVVNGHGGGMAKIGGSWIERGDDLAGCVFFGNFSGYRGGGFYYRDNERLDQLDIHGCVFESNRSIDDGGGAYITIGRQNPSGYSIVGTDFIQNSGDNGAAFMTYPQGSGYGKFAKIDSCVFEGNRFVYNNNLYEHAIAYLEFLGVPGGNAEFTHNQISNHINSTLVEFVMNDLSILLLDRLNIYYNTNCTLLFTSDGRNAYLKNIKCNENSNCEILVNGAIRRVFLENSIFTKNTIPVDNYFSIGISDSFLIKNCTFCANQTSKTGTYSLQNGYVLAENCILFNIENKNTFFNTMNFGKYANSAFDQMNCSSLWPTIHCGPGNLIGLDPMFRDTANGDYSLSPCSPLINKGSNAAAAGILSDFNGNPRIQEDTVDIGAFESPAFTLGAAPSIQPACTGFSNGSISISISPENACEPLTYHWQPAAGDGPTLNGLPPGQYSVTISDGKGRQIADTIQVTEAPLPSLALNGSDVHCVDGQGGTLSAGATGGTAPFHYLWSPPAPDTALLAHLAPGTYALTLSDANGCQDSASTYLRLDGALSLMIDGQSISCHGAADAWLSATPVTGAAPFAWQWTGWPGADSVAQPLGPGQYAVTVSDAYGCTASNTFPPTNDPAPLSISTMSQPQTSAAPPNGSVMGIAMGGTPDYQYHWNTGDTLQNLSGLTAGIYSLSVTDAHGCSATAEVEVKLMLGTEEAAGQAVMVYPNPSADWVRVELRGYAGPYALEMSDLHGRVLLRRELLSGERISLEGLPAGVYVLRARVGDGAFLGMLVRR